MQNQESFIISPDNNLVFVGPFDQNVITEIHLSNNDDKKTVAFRVKTTEFKSFFVQPQKGLICPASSIKIKVIAKPFKCPYTNINNARFKIKYCSFLPESLEYNDNKLEPNLINELFENNKREIHNKTLVTRFVMPDELDKEAKVKIQEDCSFSDTSENSLAVNADKLKNGIKWFINENLMTKKRILELRKQLNQKSYENYSPKLDNQTAKESSCLLIQLHDTNVDSDVALIGSGKYIRVNQKSFLSSIILIAVVSVAGFYTGRTYFSQVD